MRSLTRKALCRKTLRGHDVGRARPVSYGIPPSALWVSPNLTGVLDVRYDNVRVSLKLLRDVRGGARAAYSSTCQDFTILACRKMTNVIQ